MAQAGVDDFFAAGVGEVRDGGPNLTVRILAMLVEQRGLDFYVERLIVEQVHRGSLICNRVAHQLGRDLPQFLARLNFIGIGVGMPTNIGETRTSLSSSPQPSSQLEAVLLEYFPVAQRIVIRCTPLTLQHAPQIAQAPIFVRVVKQMGPPIRGSEH
jgi:hypothetical protein